VVGNRAYYFSSLDYAQKNADVIKILIEELDKVDQWAQANLGAFATELSAIWGIPKPVVDVSVGRTKFGTGPITKAILGEQQKIADTFLALGLIPKKINLLDAAAAGIA
jgi:sulfonate transport system substrate-binding protein